MEEEVRLENRRFKAPRLHLGSNKTIPSIAVDEIESGRWDQYSQLGGITQQKAMYVTVRLRDRELQTSV